jgi:uncharacterized protein (TIGR02001 family)
MRFRNWRRAMMRPHVALIVLLFAAPSDATAVELRYEAGLYSHYVWRGITLTDGAVFQPSVGIDHESGVSVELWGNVDLSEENDTEVEINEARLDVGWGRSFGKLELAAGVVEYLFPNTPYPGTREVYMNLGYRAFVSPRLELYYDVDEIDGGYGRLALAWERELAGAWNLALEGAVGYASAEFAIGAEKGLHDAGLEIRVARAFDPIELSFSGGWTDTLDDRVLPEQPTNFWAGVAIGASF